LWSRLEVELKLWSTRAKLNHIADTDSRGAQNPLPIHERAVSAPEVGNHELSCVGRILDDLGVLAPDEIVPIGIVLD
jgi:hypothetical protein